MGDDVCLNNGKTTRKEGRPAPSEVLLSPSAGRKGVFAAWTLLPGLEFRNRQTCFLFFFFSLLIVTAGSPQVRLPGSPSPDL